MLILASASPRRLDLLRLAGYEPSVDPAHVDETPDPRFAPRENAARFAREKALAVAAKTQAGQVLGADTIVTIDGLLLGKPTDPSDAAAMLKRLAGRTHEVITCVCFAGQGVYAEHAFAVTTRVTFRDLDEARIREYLVTEEWRDKAGGYAVQGHAAAFTRSVEGSYTNVVGLPLCEVVEELERRGLMPSLPSTERAKR